MTVESINLEFNEIKKLSLDIYSGIKNRISKERFKTPRMSEFFSEHHDIELYLIYDENNPDLEICLYSNEDYIHKFKQEQEFYSDFWDKDQYQTESDYYNYLQYNRFLEISDDYDSYNPPQYQFYIKNWMLKIEDFSFIINYLYDITFPKAELKQGIELQSALSFHRIQSFDDETFEGFLNNLNDTRKMNQLDRGLFYSKLFSLLGFETLCIDELKQYKQYKPINNLANPDLIAYSFFTREMYIIEEQGSKKFRVEDYHKLGLVKTMFEYFNFLGHPDEWDITVLLIGKIDRQKENQIIELLGDKRLLVCSHSRISYWIARCITHGKNNIGHLFLKKNLENSKINSYRDQIIKNWYERFFITYFRMPSNQKFKISL